MRTLTVEEMRELDARTIATAVPGAVLMDRAGRAVAEMVTGLLRHRAARARVLLVAGKGNNGGDAFVAARYLARAGHDVQVRLAGHCEEVRGDARLHLDHMLADGVGCVEAPEESDWTALHALDVVCDVVVDGLLGTGFSGRPRGACRAAIACVNRLADRARVVAIDLPSGMNGDTGEGAGEIVRADVTVSLGYPKRGFLADGAREWLGTLEVADIGLLEAEPDRGAERREIVARSEVASFFPRRSPDTHKGDYGHALLIGGARGYSGAIVLAGRAALHAGCGLVSVLTPSSIAPIVAAAAPELMVIPGEESEQGYLAGDWWGQLKRRTGEDFSAYLLGPGMTPSLETRRIAESLLAHTERPVVLDADAINVFAGDAEALQAARGPLVLTPHPGEMARLLEIETSIVQADRWLTVRDAADKTGGVVVLKGAGTVIAEAGDACTVLNLTGNPGMAKGGAGDGLAGLITGLLAFGLPACRACPCAVFLHGRAGDLAAWEKTQHAMKAGDIVARLPEAFRWVLSPSLC